MDKYIWRYPDGSTLTINYYRDTSGQITSIEGSVEPKKQGTKANYVMHVLKLNAAIHGARFGLIENIEKKLEEICDQELQTF